MNSIIARMTILIWVDGYHRQKTDVPAVSAVTAEWQLDAEVATAVGIPVLAAEFAQNF